MKRFVVGEDRDQQVLLPPSLEDYVGEDNPVRVVDVYVDELDIWHRTSKPSPTSGKIMARRSNLFVVSL